ncbi:MAG: Na+/H+ antiporter NhaB, partial [Chitinophagales bacterium]
MLSTATWWTSFDRSRRQNLEQFHSFLGNMIMHDAVGTAPVDVCTLVSELQNFLIANALA